MSRRLSISNSKRNDQKGAQAPGPSTNFSLIPLLLTGQSISPEARQALRENRLKDAAVIIMEEYGLSCVEVTHLLDIPPFKKNSARSLNRQSALMGRK
jgi:hypothetical protein